MEPQSVPVLGGKRLRHLESKPETRFLDAWRRCCVVRNLTAAYRRVVQNKGAGGVDGRSIDDLKHQIKADGDPGGGAWKRNAGSSHTHQAVPARLLSQMGLVSLLQEQRRLKSAL